MNKTITSVLIMGVFGFQNLFAMAGGQNPNQNLLEGAITDNLIQVHNALEQNADINAVDVTNATALNYAVIGDYYDIARYLIERGADPDIADATGNTPLHYAVASAPADIVKLLVEKGADLTLRNNQGQTPADLLQLLPPDQQKRSDVQRIRQYFIEAARPTPEVAP